MLLQLSLAASYTSTLRTHAKQGRLHFLYKSVIDEATMPNVLCSDWFYSYHVITPLLTTDKDGNPLACSWDTLYNPIPWDFSKTCNARSITVYHVHSKAYI